MLNTTNLTIKIDSKNDNKQNLNIQATKLISKHF